MIKICISKDFTDAPGGRLVTDGPFSGQAFREQFLEPLFKDGVPIEEIEVNLDGTYGYGTSFLEEVFGGLVRKLGKDAVNGRIKLVSTEDPALIAEIKSYMDRS